MFYFHMGCTFEHQQIIILELVFCKCSNKLLKPVLQSVTLSSECLCNTLVTVVFLSEAGHNHRLTMSGVNPDPSWGRYATGLGLPV